MHQTASTLLNRLLARVRFRHVQVLVQLAELGSVRRTAEAVGLTQPGVTQILADLEALLETPLFHRHARGVRPTPACQDMLPLAKQLLQGMAITAEAVAARRGEGEGIVRVAATTSAMNGFLVHALPQLTVRHPAMQLHVREGELDDLLLGARRGEIDALGCRRMQTVPEGWEFHALIPDEFVVACGPQHPLARKRRLRWEQLAEQLWLPAPIGAAREHFDALSARFSRPPLVCNVVTRVPAATWALLREQPMLTVVPYGVVRQLIAAGELAMLKLDESMPMEPLGMLLPSQDVPAATARFADFLRQFCAKEAKRSPAGAHPRR